MNIDSVLEEHRPMVKRIALHVASKVPSNIELDDLIQVGMTGLAESIRRFDGEQGELGAFVAMRIRGAMVDELRAADHLSRGMRHQQHRIADAHRSLLHRHGREPRDSEMIEELGVTLDEYRKMVLSSNTMLCSLEDLVADDGSYDFLERYVVDGSDPLQELIDKEFRGAFMTALNQLPERERQAITLYYEHELTLAEVGVVMGISDARVCQIQKQAIGRLQKSLEQH